MPIAEAMLLVPIRFTTANPVIRVTRGTTENLTLSVNADEDYWLSGDGNATTNQRDLVERLQTCLRTHTNPDAATFTVTISSYNIITITCTSAFSILWANAATTADETIFGFINADTASATSTVAPNQTKGVWIPSTTTVPKTFRTDTRREPVLTGAIMRTVDGQSRGYNITSSLRERAISFTLLDRAKILNEYTVATEPYSAFEYHWNTNGVGKGTNFRVYDDRTSRTTVSYQLFRTRSMERPWKEMGVSFLNRYELALNMIEVSI